MNKAKSWKPLVVGAVMVTLASPAQADLIPTDRATGHTDRDRVMELVDREDAQKRLQQLGVAPEAARDRINSMTDDEVRVVAAKMDTLAAGGALSTQEWLLVIIAILLLIIIL